MSRYHGQWNIHTCLPFAAGAELLPAPTVNLEYTITHIPAFLSISQEFAVCLLIFKTTVLLPVTYKIMQLNSIIEDVVFAFRTCVYSEVS